MKTTEPVRAPGPLRKSHVWLLLLGLIAAFFVRDLWVESTTTEVIPYSEFERLLAAGAVEDLVVSPDEIQGTLKSPEGAKKLFVTRRVDASLASELARRGVKYSGRGESHVVSTLLSWLLPLLFFVVIWRFALRGAAGPAGAGGLMAVGKSKAKVFVETDVKVRFADVAGVDEAKAELQEVVAFLKDPGSYGRLGARMPKGVLLVGPPGTGKTLLARAVAGEAGVPFFSISGSEFVEMFVGVGAARVRDLFQQAGPKAPCIIFIDELDALGRARGMPSSVSSHDEKEQTLNQLLVELDGFDPRSGIVILAATNRPEILDPALLRAGRFDRQVLLDRPDRKGRVDILNVHLRSVTLGPDVKAEEVAALTPGFTGADLANLVNEAALVATRRGAAGVSSNDFVQAIERIVAGLEKKNRLLNPREREIVAHHEMGHAVVAAALPGTDVVRKVSIIPRGIGSLGYTIQRPTEDRYLMTREELEVKMTVLLGGRAAELIAFGHLSTGAADDLVKATDIARGMAARYAMLPELGSIVYEEDPQGVLGLPRPAWRRAYSDETAREIDVAVRATVARALARSKAILERNRKVLDAGAAALLAKETLGEEELAAVFSRVAREEKATPVAA